MVRHTIACAAALAVAAGGADAVAAVDCRPYSDIARILDQKFHERPVSQAVVMGEDGSFKVLITFASPLGSTWTSVVADSKGEKACVLMSGVQFVIDRPHAGPAT